VRKIYPKTTSWIIYGATLVLVASMFAVAYSYKKSAYWEKRYLEKEKKEKQYSQEFDALNLILSNYNLENSWLIRDYFSVDSMLLTQRILNADLNNSLLESLNKYNRLLEQNRDLLSQVGFYEQKVSDLLEELQLTKNQLQESMILAEQLQKLLDENNEVQGDLFTVEFMSSYKLINTSSTAIAKTRKGFVPTKKIKQTDHINISIATVGDFNFNLGHKALYVRIADPQGNILPFVKDEVDLFRFEGEEILFSEKEMVSFTNKSFPLQIIYHPVTELLPGVYWVYVFCDGIKIGEASFDLY